MLLVSIDSVVSIYGLWVLLVSKKYPGCLEVSMSEKLYNKPRWVKIVIYYSKKYHGCLEVSKKYHGCLEVSMSEKFYNKPRWVKKVIYYSKKYIYK